jgi:hypothetical protein
MDALRRMLSIFGICTLLALTSSDILATAGFATCTGADPCRACKNCKYCHHCAKDGGTCGVCKKLELREARGSYE